jgi:hypothetical protein
MLQISSVPYSLKQDEMFIGGNSLGSVMFTYGLFLKALWGFN